MFANRATLSGTRRKSERRLLQECHPERNATAVLPDIRHVAGDCFAFQQDSAPAHRARDTVALLRKETSDFIPPDLWPPNSPDLNPVDYCVWSILQEKVYGTRFDSRTWMN